MATATILPIIGYRDESVPNRLLRPRGAIDQLAVLLPGLGYTLDMPLFYFVENFLIEEGWDVLRVEYAYNRRPEFPSLAPSEQASWLFADATAAYQMGMAQRDYRELALVGKSLGTLAMGHLLSTEKPGIPSRAIWLTPLIGENELRQQIARFGGPSLVVIGTADPHYNPAHLNVVQDATHGASVVVDGADHGMDIAGDPVASVRAVEQAVAAMVRFFM